MSASHFRELEVWQLGMTLVKSIYRLTAKFPPSERFGLTSQIQRAAVSIPSNIAEGNARGTTRGYARFISMALGSCAELQTQLLIASDLDLGDRTKLTDACDLCDRVGQMLLRLRQALMRRLETESRVPSPESRLQNPHISESCGEYL